MAITFDAAVGYNNGNSQTVLTFSHTVAVQDNRLLLVYAACGPGSANSVSGVTYNGAPLAKKWEIDFQSSAYYISCWWMIAPATGANDVVVTYAAQKDYPMAGAMSFYGVDQDTPLDAEDTDSGAADAAAASPGSAVGDVVAGAVFNSGSDITCADTEAFETTLTYYLNGGYVAGNTPTATLNWTFGTAKYYGCGANSINPAAGGPTGLSGALVRQFTGTRSLEGTLDSSGDLIRKYTGSRIVTGVLNFTGTVVAAIGLIKRAIAGALSFTGTSVRKFTGARSVSGTLDSSGSLIRKFTGLRSLVGSLSFSGTVTGIVGLISRAVSGVISFSGGVVRKLYSSRPIDGTLSFTGTTMRKFTGMRTITGTLNLTGLLIRKFTGSRVIAGTLSFLGSVIADTVEWIASLLRTMFISQENRTTTIPPENRTTTIAPENRTITIGG